VKKWRPNIIAIKKKKKNGGAGRARWGQLPRGARRGQAPCGPRRGPPPRSPAAAVQSSGARRGPRAAITHQPPFPWEAKLAELPPTPTAGDDAPSRCRPTSCTTRRAPSLPPLPLAQLQISSEKNERRRKGKGTRKNRKEEIAGGCCGVHPRAPTARRPQQALRAVDRKTNFTASPLG
jgi:hypothetical protein